MPALVSTSATLAVMSALILTVDLPLVTCTAGDWPKKFGAVNSAPSSRETAIRIYFQTG
jgi:hypothetical protein